MTVSEAKLIVRAKYPKAINYLVYKDQNWVEKPVCFVGSPHDVGWTQIGKVSVDADAAWLDAAKITNRMFP